MRARRLPAAARRGGSPGDSPITELALGPERIGGRPFEPWSASDTAYITQGAQGGHMLGVSMSLAGEPPPACVAQHSEVRRGDQLLADEDVAINTYDQGGDGLRTTNTLWLVFDEDAVPALGDQLDVITETGGRSATSHLQVVADRHRLVSLTPAEPSQYVGRQVHFTLETMQAPAGTVFDVELSTAGDPGVLELPAATATVYTESMELILTAGAVGSGELVVRYGEQEVRAAVEVITY